MIKMEVVIQSTLDSTIVLKITYKIVNIRTVAFIATSSTTHMCSNAVMKGLVEQSLGQLLQVIVAPCRILQTYLRKRTGVAKCNHTGAKGAGTAGNAIRIRQPNFVVPHNASGYAAMASREILGVDARTVCSRPLFLVTNTRAAFLTFNRDITKCFQDTLNEVLTALCALLPSVFPSGGLCEASLA
jgi:hypothetical protein